MIRSSANAGKMGQGYMKKIILIALMFCFMRGIPAFAVDGPEALFAEANRAYQEQRYQEAIEAYENILKSGFESGAVYYNLGNAYFKRRELGKTLLNYERALEFIPRDADLRANYDFARSMARDVNGNGREDFFLARFAEQAGLLFTRNEYAWAGLFFLGVLAALHLMSIFLEWSKRSRQILAGVGVFILMCYGYLGGMHYQFFIHRAILLGDASALFEPREGATTHFQVYEGNAVQLLKRQDQWSKVTRFDGKEGWVPFDCLERVHFNRKIIIKK